MDDRVVNGEQYMIVDIGAVSRNRVSTPPHGGAIGAASVAGLVVAATCVPGQADQDGSVMPIIVVLVLLHDVCDRLAHRPVVWLGILHACRCSMSNVCMRPAGIHTGAIQAHARHSHYEWMLHVDRAAEGCSASGNRWHGSRQSHLGRANARGWGAQHGVQHTLLLGIVQTAAQPRQAQNVWQ